ncbi:MAG: glutamate racemase, partial [Chitinivibrionales bacterium]
MNNRPIGVFDSGLGGLTVVKALKEIMPYEDIVYLGDTARCPYGGRSTETIRSFGRQDALFLNSMNIKMLVVACNTVSSVALDSVKDVIREIPVLGVVKPGCKAASKSTMSKRVGVIGTKATIRTRAYKSGIQKVDPGIEVFSKECPLFVPLAEEGLIDHEITNLVISYYLDEFISIGIDSIVLGCTHYPILMESIQGVIGSNIQLIDSAYWTAREAGDI